RVLPKERIAPSDEIVEVRHRRGIHIRGRSRPRHEVWPKRRVAPRADRPGGRVARDGVVAGRKIEEHFLDVLDLIDLERLDLPEPLWPERGVRVIRWVEDVVKPALRL